MSSDEQISIKNIDIFFYQKLCVYLLTYSERNLKEVLVELF